LLTLSGQPHRLTVVSGYIGRGVASTDFQESKTGKRF